MSKFSLEKKGYNTVEVDEYINSLYIKYEEKLSEQKDRVIALKNEVDALNEKLKNYVSKDEQISKALIYAVEKSEQIENNAKNVYAQEIKRINNLYVRWEELLLEVEQQYPQLYKNNYINSLMLDFRQAIEEVSEKGVGLNIKTVKNDLKRKSDTFVKDVLNRMDYVVNTKPQEVLQKTSVSAEDIANFTDLELADLDEIVGKKNKISVRQPIIEPEMRELTEDSPLYAIRERLNMAKSNSKNDKSLAEEYLNSDDDLTQNAYSKNFAKRKLEKQGTPFEYAQFPEPNESGFDLKEALNPKEDLDEIMKVFDFFEDDEN